MNLDSQEAQVPRETLQQMHDDVLSFSLNYFWLHRDLLRRGVLGYNPAAASDTRAPLARGMRPPRARTHPRARPAAGMHKSACGAAAPAARRIDRVQCTGARGLRSRRCTT